MGEKTKRETDAEAVTFSLVAENHRPGPHPQRFGERKRDEELTGTVRERMRQADTQTERAHEGRHRAHIFGEKMGARAGAAEAHPLQFPKERPPGPQWLLRVLSRKIIAGAGGKSQDQGPTHISPDFLTGEGRGKKADGPCIQAPVSTCHHWL